MYVCVCNAVTEDDVHGCMTDGGCRSAKDVKIACGMLPGCGSCTKRVHAMVSRYRTADELVDALTGGPAALGLAPELPGAPEVPAGPELPVGTAPLAEGAAPRIDLERGSAPPTAA